MKKIITLGLFVFALLIGTQTAVAQESKTKTEANAIVEANAIKTIKGLQKRAQLDKDQTSAAYEAIKEHDRDIYIIENNNLTQEEIFIKTADINAKLENKMKTILSKEQFEIYKGSQKN